MIISDGIMIALVGALLAGDGIILYMLKRRDKVIHLCELNNRQGRELVVLSTTMDNVLEAQELLVDALHDKDILNGNSVPIKEKLKSARLVLHDYTKQAKDESLFFNKARLA